MIADCRPNGSQPPPLWMGTPLLIIAVLEDVTIPTQLLQCIEEVEARGLDIEGIYRFQKSFTIGKVVHQVK